MFENWFKSGIVLGSLVIGGAACGSSTSASNTNTAAGNGTTTVAEAAPAVGLQSAVVHTHPSQGEHRAIEGAVASLLTVDEGAMVHMIMRDMTPGEVYTVWAVMMNNPENCATSPCTPKDVLGNTDAVEAGVQWAAGGVAKEDGSLTLTGWVPVNSADNKDYGQSWFGRGLTKPTTAEIHLIVNSHGPVIAGREAQMLGTYRDGCTDESLPPPFPATAKGDGITGTGKCSLVLDAIFIQKK